MSDDELSDRWLKEGEAHATATNDYVQRGLTEGWDAVGDLDSQDERGDMAQAVLQRLQEANRDGTVDEFRKAFPPAWDPMLEIIKENSLGFWSVLLLDDHRMITSVRREDLPDYECIEVTAAEVRPIPDLQFFGRSPDGSIIVKISKATLSFHAFWDDPAIHEFPLPESFRGKEPGLAKWCTQLVPFPDGKRVLWVSEDGIYVLSAESAIRISPTDKRIQDHRDMDDEDDEDGPMPFYLSMDHGNVSPDGKWIATGDQDSTHEIFDANTLEKVADIGPHSEYPHFALFSADSQQVALNACHFYNGVTIGVATADLPGLETEHYDEDEKIRELEHGMRVYCGTAVGDRYIVGDAYGYVRCIDTAGKLIWQWFVGSSITDLSLSPDGEFLAIASHSGMLHLIHLEAGGRCPHQIGTGNHRELFRWVFWKGEEGPLRW